MELRSLWWLLLLVIALVGVVAYAIRRHRTTARPHARPAVPGPTPEEEAYLDSSHIIGPVPGTGPGGTGPARGHDPRDRP